MTNLLRIQGSRVTRYVGGKRKEIVDVDASQVTDRRQLVATLEELRLNGLPPEPSGAPEVPLEQAGPLAFAELALSLDQKPPRMTPRYPEADGCAAQQ